MEDDKAILIEQNYKWSLNGQTVATVEREIGLDEAHFYRLIIDGEEKYFEDETGETSPAFEPTTFLLSPNGTEMEFLMAASDATTLTESETWNDSITSTALHKFR